MSWQPLSDRIAVKLDTPEKESEGGIILPTQAQEVPRTATVTHVGPGERKEGRTDYVPLGLKAGDRVMISQYGGVEVEVDGELLVLLREADILMREGG